VTPEELEEMASELVDGEPVLRGPSRSLATTMSVDELCEMLNEAADRGEEADVVTSDFADGIRLAAAVVRDDLRRKRLRDTGLRWCPRCDWRGQPEDAPDDSCPECGTGVVHP